MTTTLPAFVAARLDDWEATACAAADFRCGDVVMAMLPAPIFNGLRPGFPVRVLATATALRAIVALHVPTAQPDDRPPHCDACWAASWYDMEPALPVDYPCPTLRAVAGIWADHEDFMEEWSA